jgi:hypothetical protein
MLERQTEPLLLLGIQVLLLLLLLKSTPGLWACCCEGSDLAC